jgi:serine/threonine protein kinase
MSIRDPRSRPSDRQDSSGRDPTQSVSLDLEPSHPELAMGTHRADDPTKIDSPLARGKTPAPPARAASRPPIRDDADDPGRIGATLGSYRLLELLGKGGMGFVYRAEHVQLGRAVALKLLRADYARRRDAVARFKQEAQAVNRILHRNIVDVTDFIELDDGTTFIIMELLAGMSLGKWARTGVDLPRALAVLVQICDGLGAAHAVGIVHRDLKPDNIVVVPTSDGAELVKLLDFGVAKLVNRDDEDIGFQTAAGSVIGTPAYMSPEQAGGMAVDHRSDIYSLGAIMYELFCGQPMFKGRSFGEYVRKHLTEQPLPPRQTQGGAGIDERIERLIMKCLAKDPNERFGHILELRDGLLHMLGGVDPHMYSASYPAFTGSASALRPLPTHIPSLPSAPQITTQPTPLSPSQLSVAYGGYDVAPAPAPVAPWWAWLVGGTLAVGLGVVAAVWYAGSGDAPAPADPPVAPHPPSTTPIEPSVAPAKPQFVELRFDSLPSGGVYAAGRSAELCRTPCAFNVDLGDGGSTTTRTFVVREHGYVDQQITVELAKAERDFHVTLARLETIVPEEATSGYRPPRPNRPTRPGNKPRVDDPGKSLARDKKPDKPDATETVTKPEPKPPEPKPPEPKPADKGKPGTIDPADTMDPFHRHGR